MFQQLHSNFWTRKYAIILKSYEISMIFQHPFSVECIISQNIDLRIESFRLQPPILVQTGNRLATEEFQPEKKQLFAIIFKQLERNKFEIDIFVVPKHRNRNPFSNWPFIPNWNYFFCLFFFLDLFDYCIF